MAGFPDGEPTGAANLNAVLALSRGEYQFTRTLLAELPVFALEDLADTTERLARLCRQELSKRAEGA